MCLNGWWGVFEWMVGCVCMDGGVCLNGWWGVFEWMVGCV